MKAVVTLTVIVDDDDFGDEAELAEYVRALDFNHEGWSLAKAAVQALRESVISAGG